jgi:hypothetical protein
MRETLFGPLAGLKEKLLFKAKRVRVSEKPDLSERKDNLSFGMGIMVGIGRAPQSKKLREKLINNGIAKENCYEIITSERERLDLLSRLQIAVGYDFYKDDLYVINLGTNPIRWDHEGASSENQEGIAYSGQESHIPATNLRLLLPGNSQKDVVIKFNTLGESGCSCEVFLIRKTK